MLSGIFGMAGGLILMGLLGSLLPIESAMSLHAISQLSANGCRSVSLWQSIDFRAVKIYLIGALLSAGILWQVNFVPPKGLFFILLGAMPFISLGRKWLPPLRFERSRDALAAGIAITASHLSAGVSGPLLDLFFVESKKNRFQIIGTKAISQSLGHFLKLLYFGMALRSMDYSFYFYLAIVLLALVGTLVGGVFLKRMEEKAFHLYSRRIVLGVASVYLAKGFYLYLH